MSAPQRERLGPSRGVALACFVLVIAALVLLHILRPDLEPSRRRLSEYAVGEFGFLMTTAFLASAGGLLALAHSMQGLAKRSRWLRLAQTGLILAGITNGLMAVFAAQPWPAGTSGNAAVGSTAWIHDRLAMFHALCWSGVALVTPLGLSGAIPGRSRALLSASLGGFILFGLTARVLVPLSYVGVTQRIWIGAVLVWCLAHTAAIFPSAETSFEVAEVQR